MKTVVSELIIAIFKFVVPLFYVLFIFAGLSCALVTSVIAFQTVKELFPKNAAVGFISIPFLIVVSFEVTKVFVIFLNKQYSDSKNEKYLITKSLFIGLRGLLIGISGIFTLLFTFYNLNNPELASKLKEKTAVIDSSYAKLSTNINRNVDAQNANTNQYYANQIKPFQDEMNDQRNYRYANGDFRGPDWNAANQKYNEFNLQRNAALLDNENNRTQQLTENEKKRLSEISAAEQELKLDNSSSNKMVNAFLEVVTFNPNYGKGWYIFMIFILSVLISFGLEFVIWSSFTVLAINHGDYFELDLDMKTLNQKHSVATEAIDGINDRNLRSRIKNIINMKNIWHKKAKEVTDNSLEEIDKI